MINRLSPFHQVTHKANPWAAKYTRKDFNESPMLLFYEMTRACDLVCLHCRACAQKESHPEELSTEQSLRLIDQLTEFPIPPLLVLTGGDPFKRKDIYEIIAYGVSAGIEVSITPSATPLVTKEALCQLKEAGVSRIAISIDGATAASHDEMRGVDGSFDSAFRILSDARQYDIPVQVNTTVLPHNRHEIDAMAELLAENNVVLWSVFFLVPVGRALEEQRLSAEEYEDVFERLWFHHNDKPFAVKTTEAPHYRRYVLQQKKKRTIHSSQDQRSQVEQRAPLGVNDGKGVMFVGHTGEIYPSGFLPVECGRFPQDHIVKVYQQSQVFRDLRDANLLEGKCGLCEYRQICGGSRARSFALTGNFQSEEVDCLFQPEKKQ